MFSIGNKVRIIPNTNPQYHESDRNHWVGMTGYVGESEPIQAIEMATGKVEFECMGYWVNISKDPNFNQTHTSIVFVSEYELERISKPQSELDVSDKVYVLGLPNIYTVAGSTQMGVPISMNVASVGFGERELYLEGHGYSGWVKYGYCTEATYENYQYLRTAFPAIDFQVPS